MVGALAIASLFASSALRAVQVESFIGRHLGQIELAAADRAQVAFVDALTGTPGVELRPAGTEWPLLREKLLTLRLTGNDVTDAWSAAAAEAHSEHLVTFDRDFRRLLPARDLTVLASRR